MASAPSIREYQQDSEAVAAAASAVKEIGEALEKGTVTSVAFIPTGCCCWGSVSCVSQLGGSSTRPRLHV